MHSMLDAGLVDEVRMLVCPASRGKGTRIFENRHQLFERCAGVSITIPMGAWMRRNS